MKLRLTIMHRNLLVAGIIVLVGLFGWLSILQPKVNQVSVSQAKLASLQQNFADLKRVADQKPMYVALTKRIQSRLSGVELTADPRAYVPSYLKQIEQLARRDGMAVTSVIPAPAPVASATPSPTASSPGGIVNAPIIGAPLKSAAKAAGAESANSATTSTVAQATEGSGSVAGPASNSSSTPPNRALNGPIPAPGSPRANAIAYVNRSFVQLPINMELDGTYAQAQRFLRDLNRFPKLVGVGDLTLTPKASSVGEVPQLHIMLPLVAYQLDVGGAVNPQTLSPAPGAPAPARGNGG